MDDMKNLTLLYTMALAFAPQMGGAQQQPVSTFSFVASSTATADLPAAPAAAGASSRTSATLGSRSTFDRQLDRWLDLRTFDYGNRYRSIFASSGAHGFSQGQEKLIADGKFKFDADGKYGLGFHLSSGRYFNWAYADYMGGGQHEFIDNLEAKSTRRTLGILSQPGAFPDGFFKSGGAQVYLRELFLTAQPVKGVEAQFGGLAIEHGVNTEATSYDDDGYMVGERLSIKRPKQIFLSEVAYTNGYLGDYYVPNFFARGERLAESNYQQILVRKDFGKRLDVSADYTVTTPPGFPTHLRTSREGIYADIKESKVVDSVRFEAYQRIDPVTTISAHPFTFAGANGYALTLTRRVGKHFSADAGVADIDADYFVYLGQNTVASIYQLSPNGDQYSQGKRYFVRPTIPLNHYLSLTGYYSHIFDYKSDGIGQIWNAQALTAGMVVNLKSLLLKKDDQ
jgi:hypothetical protein